MNKLLLASKEGTISAGLPSGAKGTKEAGVSQTLLNMWSQTDDIVLQRTAAEEL